MSPRRPFIEQELMRGSLSRLNPKAMSFIDFSSIVIIAFLMCVSLIVISGTSTSDVSESFFTPLTIAQIKWFSLGWVAYIVTALGPYHLLRRYAVPIYLGLIIALIGLYLMPSIHSVHRWYRFPWIGFDMQPSEWAKLVVGCTLAAYLEKVSQQISSISKTLFAWLIALVPCFLILKQPDLGTAFSLIPMTFMALSFAGAHKTLTRILKATMLSGLLVILSIFTGLIPFDALRPVTKPFLRNYQIERLNPNSYHQKAAMTAIGKGGLTGSGFRKATYTQRAFLPAANTDSAFSAYVEQFGFIGAMVLIGLFMALLQRGFQAMQASRDLFGKYLALSITAGLGTHILVNMGMMTGLLPITGVPLPLVTYGGSSVLSTMASLGILQSIYTRRYQL
jgi:rod shape determining protein RodA